MNTINQTCPICNSELHLHPGGRVCGCPSLHIFQYPSLIPVPLAPTAPEEPEHDTAARIVLRDLSMAKKTLKLFPES